MSEVRVCVKRGNPPRIVRYPKKTVAAAEESVEWFRDRPSVTDAWVETREVSRWRREKHGEGTNAS